jgi:hypothetical protein
MEMDKRIVQMVDEGAANRIKELEADNKRLKETLDEAMTIITNAVSAFPSISAQAWLDKQEGE